MTMINRKQFEEHFISHFDGVDDVLCYKSPHLSYMGGQFGFSFDKKPSGQYDLVIGEYGEESPIHPQAKRYHCEQYFLEIMSNYVKDGGKLVAKFPSNFAIRTLIDKNDKSKKYFYNWINVTDVYVSDGFIIVNIIKEENKHNTKVTYSSGDVVDIDLENHTILEKYNKEQYDYIKSACDIKVYDRVPIRPIKRISIAGRSDDFEKKTKDIDLKNVLFFSHFKSRPTIETIEEVKTTLSTDMFIFESVEERDRYKDLLKNKKVLDLFNNLCYNIVTSFKVEHKHLIINPQIFNFIQ